MASEQLIVFDISDLDDQIGSLNRAYTDLGTAIQFLARDTRTRMASMAAAAVPTNSTPIKMPESFDQGLNQLKEALNAAQRGAKDLQDSLNKMDSSSGLAAPGGNVEEVMQASYDTLAEKVDPRKYEAKFSSSEALVLRALSESERAAKNHQKRTSKLVEFIEKEAQRTKDRIKEMLSNLPGNISTGFIGAIIGSITLGYLQMNRQRAQMGEMANVFEGGVDGVTSAVGRKATQFFSRWGERAQFFWGVGRKEVQAAAKLMVDNGFRVAEALESYGRDLGRVGHNVITLALGIGKHFNFSTADSMEDIVSLVRDYGMKLGESADLYVKMLGAGERSAMGVRNFTQAVMAASDPLSQMGINAETVGVFVEKLLGYYKTMGLESRYAGREVEGVAVDLMSAFSRLDTQLRLAIARDIYGTEGKSMDLLLKFSDGLRRVSEGKDDTFLENLMRSYIKTVVKRTSPERSRAILAIQGSLHVTNRTAALVYDVGDKLAEGGHLEDLSKESRENLKKSFQTEGQQISNLQKTRRELMYAMSNVGSGLMAILVSLIAALILGLKSLSAMSHVYLTPGGGHRVTMLTIMTKSYYANRGVFKGMADGWNQVLGGGQQAITALGKEFGDTFAPMIDAMALDVWDRRSQAEKDRAALPDFVKKSNQGTDSWSDTFGREKTDEERADEEEKALKGTGLISRGKRVPEYGSAAADQAMSNLKLPDNPFGGISNFLPSLVTANIGPDKPQKVLPTSVPTGGGEPAPSSNPGVPSISTEDLGAAVVQSNLEFQVGASPKM